MPCRVRALVDVVQVVLQDVCEVVDVGRDFEVLVEGLGAEAPAAWEVEPAVEVGELFFPQSRVRCRVKDCMTKISPSGASSRYTSLPLLKVKVKVLLRSM